MDGPLIPHAASEMQNLPPYAPIDVLPNELLSEAFLQVVKELCLAEPGDVKPGVKPLPDFLRAIALVNRRWHHVARTSPRLWRHMQYFEQWDWQSRGNIPFQRYLERSGALPLDVAVSGGKEMCEVYQHELFARVAGRVRSMYLNGDRQLWQQPNFTAIQWPALKKLSLSNVTVTAVQLHTLLCASPAMLELYIGFVTVRGRPMTQPVDLPNLTSVELVSMEVEPIRALLGSVASPSVRSLFIGRVEAEEFDFKSLFSRCLAGTLDGVTRLVYGGECLGTGEILDALKHTPRVEHFGLFETGRLLDESAWVRVLTERAKAGQFLVPRLNTLCLYNVSPSYRALQEFCEARLASEQLATPLRALELDSVRLVELFWSQRRKLQNAGVDIRCWWPPNHYWESNPFPSPDDY